MRSTIILTAMLAIIGASGVAWAQGAYPQGVQDSFMSTCTNLQDFNKLEQRNKADISGYCKCILDNAQKQVSVSDYEKNKTSDPKDFPMMPSLEKIANECSAKYLKK